MSTTTNNHENLPAIYNGSMALLPTEQELAVYLQMAQKANSSKFYQALGGESGIVAIMLYARELGVPPMQAISGGIHCIQGKVEMSARMMNFKIRQAGHRLDIIEHSNAKCIIKGTRKDTGEVYTSEFTVDDARTAGLVKPGGNWEKYPKNMVFARAISDLAKFLFPDVIGTSYVEGEIRDAIAIPENTFKNTDKAPKEKVNISHSVKLELHKEDEAPTQPPLEEIEPEMIHPEPAPTLPQETESQPPQVRKIEKCRYRDIPEMMSKLRETLDPGVAEEAIKQTLRAFDAGSIEELDPRLIDNIYTTLKTEAGALIHGANK